MVQVYLDSETTGRRSHDAHIIEVAAVVHDERHGEIDHFETLANPGEEAILLADPEALRVNGITPEMMRRAPPAAEAAAKLRAFLDRHWGAELHAFNNEFDVWFFAREPWGVKSVLWGECVMLAAMGIMGGAGALKPFAGGDFKYPSLEEAARFFRVPYEKGHRALPDVRIAAAVHTAILKERASDAMINSEVTNFIDNGL